MDSFRLSRVPWIRLGLVLGALALAAGLLAALALAAQYTIDTDDRSIAEWDAQGIVMFQDDPAESAVISPTATISPSDDIVAAWVASGVGQSGVPSLSFRTYMTDVRALDTANHVAAALIDCDRNGQDNERRDRWAVYHATGFPRGDEMILYTGDTVFGLASSEVLPKLLGQRVQSSIEWAVPIADLPEEGVGEPELDPVDCRNDVNIRFATMAYDPQTGIFTVLDMTGPSLGWNIALGEPVSATLRIQRAISPTDALLLWNPTAQSEAYALLRSRDPYTGFVSLPITPTVVSTGTGVYSPTLFYTDTGVLSPTIATLFYEVQGTSGGTPTVDPSNLVGLANFPLIPGD